MAAIGKQIAVAQQAISLVHSREAIVKNLGTKPAFIGGSNVTAVSGYELEVGESIRLDATNDELFGICGGTDTTTIHVVAVRKAF